MIVKPVIRIIVYSILHDFWVSLARSHFLSIEKRIVCLQRAFRYGVKIYACLEEK